AVRGVAPGPPSGRGPVSPPRTARPHRPNVVLGRGAGGVPVPAERLGHQRRYLARNVGSGRPVLERDLGAAPEHVLERQRPLAIDTRPEADVNISSSRETAEGARSAPTGAATSGRRPAKALTTSPGPRRAAGK